MAYPDKADLPKGAETYLKSWAKSKLYGRTKDISNKYLTKGNEVEEQAIDLLAEYLGGGFLFKNELHYFDDHMTGMPDVTTSKQVFEIKSPWDWSTFPAFESKIPDSGYWWQCQGYMALTGLAFAQLCYVLCDTPEEQIQREAKNKSWQLGLGGEVSEELYEEVERNMSYSDIPLDQRVKIFDIDCDEKAIQQIRNRVELCRKFLSNLDF